METSVPRSIQHFLNNAFDIYRKYFSRTFAAALIIAAASLITFSFILFFSPDTITREFSRSGLLYVFVMRNSSHGEYFYSDAGKFLFLFLCAIFAVGFYRSIYQENPEKKSFLGSLNMSIVMNLIAALVLVLIIDGGTVYVQGLLDRDLKFQNWFYRVLYETRICFPGWIFAFAVTKSIAGKGIALSRKKLLALLIMSWLFNEFFYESSYLIRITAINLILLPLPKQEARLLIELLISMPLLALYVLGFGSSMIYPSLVRLGIDPEILNTDIAEEAEPGTSTHTEEDLE